MFLDHVILTVQAGRGGDGCVGWRREKYVPKGGPNGGDGGNGGNVFCIADANTDTLSHFTSRKIFRAKDGEKGMTQDRHGQSGQDLTLKVPPGTIITDTAPDGTVHVLADLQNTDEQVLLVRGGRGGYGNAHFKSAVRQRPDFAENGEPGEEKKITLDLKMVADIGIIGFPSVGKSTLISVISHAKPKIAAYPFTTLVPNLGVVTVDDRSYVVCDVPGLIEGASDGKGLGDQFLRHIERCGLLVHVLDLSRAVVDGILDPIRLRDDYRTIRNELRCFSPLLAEKQEVVVLNKIDLVSHESLDAALASLEAEKINVFASVSTATHHGTNDLKKALLPLVLQERVLRAERLLEPSKDPSEPVPILRPHHEGTLMGDYTIEVTDTMIRVHGKRIEQMTAMTDFSSPGGVRRFRDIIERIGLRKELEKRMLKEAITHVSIGTIAVEEFL